MTSVETTPATTAVVDEATPRGRFWRYLLVFALVMLVVFAGIGVVNYRLNPLSYNGRYLHDAAQALTDGHNFANYDTSINWRALRREQIKQWTSTPDVIVFGGSRWWEAHADLVPGRTFKNLWVSNDQAEDALALTYLLESANRLPKVLILSLRFISFQPPADREFSEWQEWAPEYRAMAGRLGIEPHPHWTTAPVRKWSSLFYGPGAYSRVRQVERYSEQPGPTDSRSLKQLEVIASDGSIYWSEASRKKFTKAAVDKAVAGELRRIGQRAPKIDRSLVAALATTVRYLQSKGVTVVLAQTPYHPTFWNTVKNRPFGHTLLSLESIASDMQQQHGVTSVGTYDPATLGCVASDYIDHIHAGAACVGKVLRLIPALAEGA
jgi:hypothetical protein